MLLKVIRVDSTGYNKITKKLASFGILGKRLIAISGQLPKIQIYIFQFPMISYTFFSWRAKLDPNFLVKTCIKVDTKSNSR